MERQGATRALGAALFACYLLVAVQIVASEDGACSEGLPVRHHDEPSVFDELTKEEIEKVTTFMYDQEDLNVKRMEEATMDSTYIYLMEILPPVKAEVLEYLDNKGSKPERFARVILYRGDLTNPAIEEFKVGPLPNPTSITPVIHESWRNPIPYEVRSPAAEVAQIKLFLEQEFTALDPILEDVVGYTNNNCTRCIDWMFGVPGDFISGNRKMTLVFCRKVDGLFVHPIGLEFRIDMKATQIKDWVTDMVWFRGELYKDVDSLVKALRPGTEWHSEEKAKKVIYEDNENLYSSLNFRGDPRPSKPLRGPATYYPDGRRYEVDGHHIKWQGWSFDFTVPSVTGMTLYDVRFLDERIIYELSVQEISVRYSGKSPFGHFTAYHDSVVQIGRETYQLFPGVDCPKRAEFFDFNHYIAGVPVKFKNSACVFELDRGIPLRRHYQSDQKGGYEWYHGMPDNALVMRSMVTAWNYDYILDYIFHQQGGVEVVLSLTGYILSTWYVGPEDDPYGFETFPNGLGNIHHHLAHFKVDLDIQGTSNRFETLNVHIEPDEDLDGSTNPNMIYKIRRDLRETEQEAAYKFNFETPKYLLFYNEEVKNKYGNPKAYRIANAAMSKWLTPVDWRMEKSFSWARYQVAVTKHKMDEYTSSNMYSSMDMSDPIMTFQSFIDDDENIVDEDLVTWVTVGTIHIPHTEDIPIVQTHGVQLTFHILPYNYFDGDASLASRDNVRVTPGKDGETVYTYSGVEEDLTCVPRDVKTSGAAASVMPVVGILMCSFFAAFF